MKSQIFTGVALLIAGIYTVEFNENKIPDLKVKESKVLTTQEIIQKSYLHKVTKNIELKQDSINKMIREKVNNRVIDSTTVPKDSVIRLK